MNQLVAACATILDQLDDLVGQVKESDFISSAPSLSGATVGQHLRHTVEFFICLEEGFEKGVINYDKRNHDRMIEQDKFLAMAALGRIRMSVVRQAAQASKPLSLEVAYDGKGEQTLSLPTNYERELVYNIEHAVHHMAIMKIGIREVAPYVQLPQDFGVAISTLRYQQANHVRLER